MSVTHEVRLTVKPKETLLDAICRETDIYIFSSCGGHGSCGRCKVYCIDERLSALSNMERRRLDTSERSAGMRLACQAWNLTGQEISTEVRVVCAERTGCGSRVKG